jgi:glycosyltransferase involved in cell wall biosynthesis
MISFLFAYRNRDSKRVLLSLKSLALQEHENFEVVFVDYGSDDDKASAVKKLVESFAFSSYYYIAHPGLLWNKSKALNYAASKAKGDYVFVADVDICFNNKVVKMLQDYRQPGTGVLTVWCLLGRTIFLKLKVTMSFTIFTVQKMLIFIFD